MENRVKFPPTNNQIISNMLKGVPIDPAIKSDVNHILERALQNSEKITERGLTLFEILNAYDKIVQEDDKNEEERGYRAQMNP